MNLSERVRGILLRPNQEWQTIAGETTTIAELYKSYVIILAAIGPVAAIFGMSLVGFGGFRVPIASSLASGVVNYILTLVGVYILALIIDALAPTFSGVKNINQGFKVAVYSSTPGWIVGVLFIIPALSPLMILGLYGLYILYLGVPVLMKSPRGKVPGIHGCRSHSSDCAFFIVIGYISRAFISYPTAGMPGMAGHG